MKTLVHHHYFEEEIKKSRFIVNATHARSPEEALAYLETIRDSQANHNCWAYRIGQEYRFSDDGEPGGTAGKPILNAIEKQDIDQVIVVVTRFFGGTKLGAGGLIRAYGGCAAKCLQSAKKNEIVLKSKIKIRAGFEWTGPVYGMLEKFKVQKLNETYHENGVDFDVMIRQQALPEFKNQLRDLSSGNIKIEDSE